MDILETLAARYPVLAAMCPQIDATSKLICDSQRAGGTLFLCGNGGSAADADHIAAELLKSFGRDRPLRAQDKSKFASLPDFELLTNKLERGVRAVSLCHPASLMSAVANDSEPALCFAQPLYACAKQGDVLLAISTSGNSRNVLLAAQTARAVGVKVVGLCGESESKLDDLCDIALKVPARETFHVQELHLPLYHALCLLIEETMFA